MDFGKEEEERGHSRWLCYLMKGKKISPKKTEEKKNSQFFFDNKKISQF
jgi:hypothetical protein